MPLSYELSEICRKKTTYRDQLPSNVRKKIESIENSDKPSSTKVCHIGKGVK